MHSPQHLQSTGQLRPTEFRPVLCAFNAHTMRQNKQHVSLTSSLLRKTLAKYSAEIKVFEF
jgi:hypothetical protein